MSDQSENVAISSENREIDLNNYLPEFLSDYREFKAVTGAENPEFRELRGAVQAAREAGFIRFCSERYLARFEKLLGIFPAEGETISERRRRVLLHWNESPPYTVAALRNKLALICGEGDFFLSVDCEGYSLDVMLDVFSYSVLLEIERLLRRIVPANIVINSVNKVACEADSRLCASGAVSEVFGLSISSELDAVKEPVGAVFVDGSAAVHTEILIE